jgi:hypothetical protein
MRRAQHITDRGKLTSLLQKEFSASRDSERKLDLGLLLTDVLINQVSYNVFSCHVSSTHAPSISDQALCFAMQCRETGRGQRKFASSSQAATNVTRGRTCIW